MKRFGRLIVTLFIALLFVSVANLAARAQDATFTAKGDITLSPNALTAVRSAVRDEIAKGVNVNVRPSGVTKLQSSVDDVAGRMNRIEDNQHQLTLVVKDLNDSSRQAIAGLERKLDNRYNPWWLVLAGLLLILLAYLAGRRGDVTINNNLPETSGRCDCGCEDDGFVLKLGRSLQDGDEIIIRKPHAHTSHAEKLILGGKSGIDIRFGEIPEPEDKGTTIPVDEAGK